MSSDLQNVTNGSLAIADEKQLLKHFQSLYYLIKGKRDTDIKLFNDFKQFAYSDILDLNDKIHKKLELHESKRPVKYVFT